MISMVFPEQGDFVTIPINVTIEPIVLLHDPSDKVTFNFDPGKAPEDQEIDLTSEVSIAGLTSTFIPLYTLMQVIPRYHATHDNYFEAWQTLSQTNQRRFLFT